MCRNDFKLSEGAAAVCASIADFASPPLVRDLFVKSSLQDMFAGIEANAAKVCFCCLQVLFVWYVWRACLLTVLYAQTLMLSRALSVDISQCYGDI